MIKTLQILFMLFFALPTHVYSGTIADAPALMRFDEKVTLERDTEFSGAVYIKDSITVPKGVTLTILPGTTIEFGHPGLCDDGNVNPSITVFGKLVATGTKEAPITFTSATKKERSAFGEVFFSDSEGARFEWCTFEYAHWAIHTHDSDITVKNCKIKNSFGGIRFKGDKIIAVGNLFSNIEIGFRFWQAAPEITGNRFTNVDTAIFAREKVKGVTIKGNKFVDITGYFIKLGEMQEFDVTVEGNDFGSDDEKVIRKKIFDKEYEEYVGRVIIK